MIRTQMCRLTFSHNIWAPTEGDGEKGCDPLTFPSGVTTRVTSVFFNNFGVCLPFHVVPSSGQNYSLYLQRISCTPCLMLIRTVCLSVPHLQSHSTVPWSLYCHFVTIHQMPLDFPHRHNSSNFPYQPCRCLSNPFGIVCLLSVWPFPASWCCKPFHLNFVHKSLSPCCRPASPCLWILSPSRQFGHRL